MHEAVWLVVIISYYRCARSVLSFASLPSSARLYADTAFSGRALSRDYLLIGQPFVTETASDSPCSNDLPSPYKGHSDRQSCLIGAEADTP